MKKYILFYAILPVSILMGSCNKQLNQSPTTSKTAATFPESETEAEEYIDAVYAALQSSSLYGAYVPALGEIPSDNTYDEVPANDNEIYGQLDLFTSIPSNSLLSSTWNQSYVAIQRANVVLNRIGNISYSDSTVKNNRIGEMKFIRALCYFNMVRIWGDVPLVTQETTDPNSYFGQGRTSKDSVYDQIIQDLEESIAVLPETASESGRVTLSASQALLGKVYLTKNDWNDAKTYLQAIVDGKQHSLLSSPSSIFDIDNEDNAEIIFAVQFASGINGNSEGSSMIQQFSPSGFISGAKGHNLPTLSLYNLYSKNDTRRDAYIGLTADSVPYSKKITQNASVPADGGSDFVVLRYADVLLMLAEADNELGNTSDAITYLNMIRNRAGLANTMAVTQAALRDSVTLERRFELVGEGHRWFDLLRTGDAVSVMNTWFKANKGNTTVDDHNLLQPIPQTQIDTDPTLTQNDGY